MCFAGAGFFLQSEGSWLSDEECAGSFGNHQVEPALDGQESAYNANMAEIEPHPISAPLTGNRVMSSRQQQRLHYCRTVSLHSYYPGETARTRLQNGSVSCTG